jgi:signal transduction histidine kinase
MTEMRAHTAEQHTELFHSMFDDLPVGIALTEKSGKVIYSNKKLSSLTGCNKEDLYHKPVEDIHPFSYQGSHYPLAEAFEDIATTPVTLDPKPIFRGHKKSIVSTTLSTVLNEYICCTIIPVSSVESKAKSSPNAEKNPHIHVVTRAGTGEVLKNLVNQSPVATCMISGAGRIVRIANEQMVALWKGDDMVGKSLEAFIPEFLQDEILPLIDKVFDDGIGLELNDTKISIDIDGKQVDHYFNFLFKPFHDIDNEPCDVILMAVNHSSKLKTGRNRESIHIDTAWQYRDEFRKLYELRIRQMELINEGLKENNDRLSSINRELTRSNQDLSQYAYVASHDLQEPIRKVRILSDMLLTDAGLQLKDKKIVQKITRSCERMSVLIRDLLHYSKLLKPDMVYEPVDLQKILQGVFNDFEISIQERNAQIRMGNLPVIQAVPHQMNQLFYNLLSNALKFVAPGSTPEIDIYAVPITPVEAGNFLKEAVNGQQYYDISFRDNGIGFESSQATEIFEVFKRLETKENYQGSGIGLALCRRIVLNHNGFLFASSEPEKGATFHIIIPANHQ